MSRKSKGHSKSSKRWLKEHFSDPFVQAAQKQNWRSRAVFKLMELQERDKIIKPGMNIVDLGAAPGGWCQYAKSIMGDSGKIIAIDLLPFDPIVGVDFIQGDFADNEVYEELLNKVAGNKIDLVMSDLAPNMSGLSAVDQPKSMYLVELALEFAEKVLDPKGTFVVKIFQGEGFDEFVRNVRAKFKKVVIRKPKASRPRSREVYLLASEYKELR